MVKNIDFRKGPLVKSIIAFAWPLVLSGIFQLLFNAVDTMMVGRFLGSEYLAAIGATAPIVGFVANSFMTFSLGISVLISRGVSGKDGISHKEVTSIVLVLSLILGIIVGGIAIALVPWLLRLMDTPEEVIELSILYIRIYLAGMPFFLFYNFGSAIIRSLGNSVISLVYVGISGACNVVLNMLFIKLGMGVAGVAIATVLSQLLSAALVYGYIAKNSLAGRPDWKNAPLIVNQVFKLGLPAAMQTALLNLTNIIIQEEINKFGTTVLAGQTVYLSLNGFLLAVINAITQTAVVFIGQNDAANDKRRVLRSALWCNIITFVLGSGLGTIMYIFADIFCLPYTGSSEVVEVVKSLMPIAMVTYGICGCMEAMAGCNRGMGKSLLPTVLYLIGVGLFRIFWLKCILTDNNTVQEVFWCYPLSWLVTAVLELALFLWLINRKSYIIGTKGGNNNG